jgi:hypothetical protein
MGEGGGQGGDMTQCMHIIKKKKKKKAESCVKEVLGHTEYKKIEGPGDSKDSLY